MFIPSTRTFLLRKLITIAAAMANIVEAVLVRKPDAELTASVAAGCVFAKRRERRRLPPDIKGELASATAWVIWVSVAPDELEARPSMLRKALGPQI
jgi:hypothetical protein